MELVFNELSFSPISENRILACERVNQFIKTYGHAMESGFNGIRFSLDFSEIELAAGFTLLDWLSYSDQRILKDLLLAARRYPFIKEEDVGEQHEYLAYSYYFEDVENRITARKSDGLAAAHIYSTLAISFAGFASWEKNLLTLRKVRDEDSATELVEIRNVFSPSCLEADPVEKLIEEITEIVLIETDIPADDKPMHFKPDHGTDTLAAFGKRIRKSPHVVSIVNSLEWNPRFPRFILEVFPNGIVHVVLYWTDRGLGMAIQTTGRNFRETDTIARLLQNKYSN